jgi:hypothetical protein
MNEIATESNSTTFLPIPLDLFRPFFEKLSGAPANTKGSSSR